MEEVVSLSADDAGALVLVGWVFDSVVLVCCLAGVDFGESVTVVLVVLDSLPKRVLRTASACSIDSSGMGLLIPAQPACMGNMNSDSALDSSFVQWNDMHTRTLSMKDPLAALHIHFGRVMPQLLKPMQLSMHCENTVVDSTWLRKGRRTAVASSALLRCFLTPIFFGERHS